MKNRQTHSFCLPLEFSVAVISNAFVKQKSAGTKKTGANLLPLWSGCPKSKDLLQSLLCHPPEAFNCI